MKINTGNYLKDMVYAANDGIVTTFAIVAGVAGASLGTNVILILGFANLFADGFAMAIGNYLGTKSELDYLENQKGKTSLLLEKTLDPVREALITLVAFVVAGLMPLLPYIFKLPITFNTSVLFTGIALFGVGALRTLITKKHWLISGLEMLFVGTIAACVAYITGYLIQNLA